MPRPCAIYRRCPAINLRSSKVTGKVNPVFGSTTNGVSALSGRMIGRRMWRSLITIERGPSDEKVAASSSGRGFIGRLYEAERSFGLPRGEGHWRARFAYSSDHQG